MEFQQIHLIFVSGYCMHFIFKICQTVAVYLTNFLNLIFGVFSLSSPTVRGYNSIFWQKKNLVKLRRHAQLSSWVENPKNRDHLRSRSVINEIETRSGVIESTFFFTPTSPNCYFSLHIQRTDLNKRPVKGQLIWKCLFGVIVSTKIATKIL